MKEKKDESVDLKKDRLLKLEVVQLKLDGYKLKDIAKLVNKKAAFVNKVIESIGKVGIRDTITRQVQTPARAKLTKSVIIVILF